MINKIKKKLAFTIVELLFVVGIVVLLATAAFVIYPKYMAQRAVTQAQQELSLINAASKDFISDGAVSTYAYVYGDVVNSLLNNKSMPEYFRAPPGSPWGLYLKSLDAYVDMGPLSNSYPFMITTVIDIPNEACRPLVTRFYSQYDQIFPYSDNGGVGGCYASTVPRKPPLESILSACDTYGGSSGKVWIGFLNQVKGRGGCAIPY